MAEGSGYRWGKSDDAKLLELIRMPHGGVDPTKQDTEDLQALWNAHWSKMKFKTFSNRIREKFRDFAVSRSLDGHRARKLL